MEGDYFTQYHQEHRERRLQQMRERYARNRETVLAERKASYDADTKRMRRLENLAVVQEREREVKRRQYELNPEKFKSRVSRWRKDNPEYLRKVRNRPELRLHNNVSRAIRKALHDRKAGRSWESLVGYKLAALVCQLESQFEIGMTWENYGEWELDHVRPVSSFDFSDESAVRVCWALSNLQPLWMSDNRRKYNRMAI